MTNKSARRAAEDNSLATIVIAGLDPAIHEKFPLAVTLHGSPGLASAFRAKARADAAR
jgi:hypothetical protein